MNILLSLLFVTTLMMFFDWALYTRVAAYYSDREYDYSITKRRAFSLLMIISFLVYFFYKNDVNHPWLNGLIIVSCLLIVYSFVVSLDVKFGTYQVDKEDGGGSDLQ